MGLYHQSTNKLMTFMKKNDTHILRTRARYYNPNLRPVILLHGFSSTQNWNVILNTSSTNLFGGPEPNRKHDALISVGYTVYEVFTGTNWGTNVVYPSTATGGTGQQAIEDGIAQASDDGLPTTTVFITGNSGGGCNALNWAIRNKTRLQGMYLNAPAYDISFLYDQDALAVSWGLGTISNTFRAVHGGTDKTTWLPLSEPYDPNRNQADVADIGNKIAICSGEIDEAIPWAGLVTFCANTGITLASAGNVGHLTFDSGPGFDEHNYLRWFQTKS